MADSIADMDGAVSEANTMVKSPDHELSVQVSEKHPEQGDSCKELEEDASVSVQNDSEVEFVKKPGEFTTEVFKIEIRNLPRYSGYKVRIIFL